MASIDQPEPAADAPPIRFGLRLMMLGFALLTLVAAVIGAHYQISVSGRDERLGQKVSGLRWSIETYGNSVPPSELASWKKELAELEAEWLGE